MVIQTPAQEQKKKREGEIDVKIRRMITKIRSAGRALNLRKDQFAEDEKSMKVRFFNIKIDELKKKISDLEERLKKAEENDSGMKGPGGKRVGKGRRRRERRIIDPKSQTLKSLATKRQRREGGD